MVYVLGVGAGVDRSGTGPDSPVCLSQLTLLTYCHLRQTNHSRLGHSALNYVIDINLNNVSSIL